MFFILINANMIIAARQNLKPAENIGVNDSSPKRIAIQVEPQIKQRAKYARNILTASLFNFHPS